MKVAGLPHGGGWDKLLDKLREADASVISNVERMIGNLYSDIVIAGTKDIFVYPLDQVQTEALHAALTGIEVSQSSYQDSYPFPLSPTQLANESTDHKLVKKVTHSNGDISLILCAKRSEEERTSYQYNEVTEAVKMAFDGFDEFVTIKRSNYQVFDVVNLRKSLHRIEVLVDQPTKLRPPETNEKRGVAILGRLAHYSDVLQAIYHANTPLNLAPCISGLYLAKREGRVSHLSFRTPTGLVNRGAKASEDLRVDAFIQGGIDIVGEVTPYDVTVAWDSIINVTGAVSVQVGMPISGLATDSFHVRHARIIDARGDNAVTVVVNKLVSYASN
ncbi:hypothetical protein CHU94_11375 [Rhodoferax sp. TH121]|nr:hypothetical protein CHU94_11375 [Rhodoferax sp. TH121]